MKTEIIKFTAADGTKLDGILMKRNTNTNKVLIQIHGMTSNCFKIREEIIAKKITTLNVDVLNFNNRGSDVARYCKKITGEKTLQGTAYEEVEDGYYDVLGAIAYAVEKGYNEIYLEGHSLGTTKIIYTYNKMCEENSDYLKYIKAIILLSLVDIPDMMKTYTPQGRIELAEQLEKENRLNELMPDGSSIHALSVKTYLRYTKYYSNIDFAQFHNADYKYEILNKIQVPLFMRWGNNKEFIKQDVTSIISAIKNNLTNKYLDIDYIDGANHSYDGYEESLAQDICGFLKEI